MEDPRVLFKDVKLLPNKDHMTIEEQMNSLARLVILVFFVMYFLSWDQSVLFLTLSLVLIIILYYINKKQTMVEEQYKDFQFPKLENILRTAKVQGKSNNAKILKSYPITGNSSKGYNKAVNNVHEVSPNPLFRSKNQALVGGANPKTFIQPVVPRPIDDYKYWSEQNDFSIPQAINKRNAQDFYASGYFTGQEACGSGRVSESAWKGQMIEGFHEDEDPNVSSESSSNRDPNENTYETITTGTDNGQCKYSDIKYIDDFVNNENNIKYGMPINYNSSPYQLQESQTKYNKQLFLSDINGSEGQIYKTQYIEPLSTNIGISYTQQIPPRGPTIEIPTYQEDVDKFGRGPQDVFDPRDNGYGSNTRQYNYKMLGQPRFAYKDIDDIRRPNFISRSNVDSLNLGPGMSYGPMAGADEIVDYNEFNRERVESAFLDNTIDFRNDMMNSLSRKVKVQGWQTKNMPRARANQFNMGGMRF